MTKFTTFSPENVRGGIIFSNEAEICTSFATELWLLWLLYAGFLWRIRIVQE